MIILNWYFEDLYSFKAKISLYSGGSLRGKLELAERSSQTVRLDALLSAFIVGTKSRVKRYQFTCSTWQ